MASAEETAQLSRAQTYWRKHWYINWLLVAASFMTMVLSRYAEYNSQNAIISFVGVVTGECGLMSSDPYGLWQAVQPIQHQHLQKLKADVLASCSVFLYALSSCSQTPKLAPACPCQVILTDFLLCNADETASWMHCCCSLLLACPRGYGLCFCTLLQQGCRL